MSQMPPYPPGDPYAQPPQPPPYGQQPYMAPIMAQPMGYYGGPGAGRPGAVTALAIIGIVWGSLNLLCNGVNLIPYMAKAPVGNPIVDQVRDNPALLGWTIGSGAIRSLLAVFLIIASIAALKLRPWSRPGLRGYAVIIIIIGLIDAAVSMLWLAPMYKSNLPNANATAVQVGYYVGFAFGLAVALAYPICLLIILGRPHIKAAFSGQAMADSYYNQWPGQGV